MIKISVDESAAFDAISILEIKISKSEGASKDKVKTSYEKLLGEVVCSVGAERCAEIINSPYYTSLKKANEDVFDLVEMIEKSEDSDAKRAQQGNMKRYLAKKELQIFFFSDEQTEIKL